MKPFALAAVALSASITVGCSNPISRLELPVSAPPCRLAAAVDIPVKWLSTADERPAEDNLAWCAAVGPVAVGTTEKAEVPADGPGRGDVLIVSWNMAVGGGDLEHLLRRLEADERAGGRLTPDFVVLLQEAYRTGEAVPQKYTRTALIARRIARGERAGRDVVSLAHRLKMNFVYAPSMRNGRGAPGHAAEDRGNAILSTLPLSDISIVELPLERQRRAAVAARVSAGGTDLTVVSVHLDTRRPFWKGWVFGGPAGRQRQALALAGALATIGGGGPLILGGDFNTLAGRGEPAIRSLESRFARAACGNPRTYQWGLQLDYLFASERAAISQCDRHDQRFGSDHHPLIARLATGTGLQRGAITARPRLESGRSER
jgi:endonuclease/exonuclease/phosphatase family metal-dependent hydrolase